MEKKPNQENRRSNENEMNLYIASISKENRDLKAKLNEASAFIDSLQTQNLFSYINFAMKIMDHPEMYSDSFVNAMSNDIENLMMRLHDIMVKPIKNSEDGTGSDSEEA